MGRITLSNFEIKDRRGEKKETAAPIILETPDPQPTGDRSKWKNIGYMIVLVPSNAGPLVTGRAVGLRSDEKCFIADYFLPQIYPEHFDWTPKARERLETFLGCECSSGTPCATHKMLVPQWIKADTQRLELIGNSAVPEAIEIMVKADRARKAGGIVVPR
jgi:hypothetical protein